MEHRHLHQARVDRQLDLLELAARTALSPTVIEKIDEGRFTELPPGIYARAAVRVFAAEVGVDPSVAVRELDHLLPAAPDPFPMLREVAASSSDPWGAARCAALATDATILLLLNAALIGLVSVCSGIAATVMLTEAAPALSVILTVPVVAYFILFAGIGGRTPGASLYRVPAPPRTRLTLHVILHRAVAGFQPRACPVRRVRRFAVN
ncbi:MAG TPA: helix-turn-helix domain-containing protein [Vicinamibacterales bacterium]|nr:helix-turn-helix domain-containing protein [Vicinamibacterales bacterium]